MMELRFPAARCRYRDPVDVLATTDPLAVRGLLRDAQRALRDGYAIAGYVTHEGGSALEGLAVVPPSPSQPLVALGVFRAAEPLPTGEPANPFAIGPLVAQTTRKAYADAVRRVRAAIADGDVYQVNVTVPFACTFDGDALAAFAALTARAGVPYAAYVRHEARSIISLSPELFLRFEADRVRTLPMKGTSRGDAADELGDAKNRAEHVMIVDLLRNDLARVASRVDVKRLFAVEHYPTFATMISDVVGTLCEDAGFADVLSATLPPGSVTGAPKRAALAMIVACEDGYRDVAMGTIGYQDSPRRGTWNVAIRTLVIDHERGVATTRVGGGIVADSHARAEWAEILIKRRALTACSPTVELLETIRVEPEGTLPRLDVHLERLDRAAFALGLTVDITAAAAAVRDAARGHRTAPALLRLVAGEARPTVTERALQPFAEPARLILALVTLRAADPLLRWKTTMRTAYDAALRFAAERGVDEALLCNDAGTLADGARTTLFVERDGVLVTPGLADGALAGVLRAELLADGRAIEGTITREALVSANVFVGSAARGLLSAQLF